MEAPDKIYTDNRGVYAELPIFSQIDANVEYIRKDALLERLEKVAAEYKKRSDEGELVWQNMCGINEAIDILNKM
jgi:hypothetical protein